MLGKSHLLLGLTAGVVLDSFVHLSGTPLTMAKAVTVALLVKKATYYCAVGFGALLPDIDNARSIMGRRFGSISKQIQHAVGHRTLLHSLLGLTLGSLLALGLEQVVVLLLSVRGIHASASFTSGWYMIFFAVLFGCIIHIVADALTIGGVPLLWPNKKRFGFPPKSRQRFRTGTWPEFVIVWASILLVGIAIWQSLIVI